MQYNSYLFAIQHQKYEQTADDESAGRREDEGRRLEYRGVEFREYLALLEGHHAIVGRARGDAVGEARGRGIGQVAQHVQLLHARQLLEMESDVNLVGADYLESQDYRVLTYFHLDAVLEVGAQALEEVGRLLGEQRLVFYG